MRTEDLTGRQCVCGGDVCVSVCVKLYSLMVSSVLFSVSLFCSPVFSANSLPVCCQACKWLWQLPGPQPIFSVTSQLNSLVIIAYVLFYLGLQCSGRGRGVARQTILL